eukprot:8812194-Lingulodinium_polyedra.AAC.1
MYARPGNPGHARASPLAEQRRQPRITGQQHPPHNALARGEHYARTPNAREVGSGPKDQH